MKASRVVRSEQIPVASQQTREPGSECCFGRRSKWALAAVLLSCAGTELEKHVERFTAVLTILLAGASVRDSFCWQHARWVKAESGGHFSSKNEL